MSLPLEGITVLDLSRLLPGPLCSGWLAELGAEVIKIEGPEGDLSRQHAPLKDGTSVSFQQLNHAKEVRTFNLKDEKGRESFLKLTEKADVLIESFRPGVMKKLGVGFEEVKKHNSTIVYLSLTGFGQDGKLSNFAGHDINFMALSGMLDQIDGLPNIQFGDIAGGSLTAAFAVMVGLFHSKIKGIAKYLDVSMFDSLFSLNPLLVSQVLNGVKSPAIGNDTLSGKFPNYNIYETKDLKKVAIGAYEKKFWANFCEKVSKPQWLERQWDSALRLDVAKVIVTKSRDEWREIFDTKDSCITPVLTLNEAIEQRHVKDREIFKINDQGLKYPALPFKIDGKR